MEITEYNGLLQVVDVVEDNVALPRNHRWVGTVLQWQRADGSWEVGVDLMGPMGDITPEAQQLLDDATELVAGIPDALELRYPTYGVATYTAALAHIVGKTSSYYLDVMADETAGGVSSLYRFVPSDPEPKLRLIIEA